LKFDWIFARPAYLPGQGPKPQLPAATVPVSETSWASHEIFQLGILCHQRGYFWEAHESLESLWHLQSGTIKDFVQILIQRSAADLNIQQKDEQAAYRLRTSALTKLKSIPNHQTTFLGLDLKHLARELESKTQGEARST